MNIESLFGVKRSMTPEEGFSKIKKYLKNDKIVLLGCRDYGSDFMFFSGPPGTDPKKKNFVGSPLIVSKKTGKVTEYENSNLRGKMWEPVTV